jgi:hypothetical protein
MQQQHPPTVQLVINMHNKKKSILYNNNNNNNEFVILAFVYGKDSRVHGPGVCVKMTTTLHYTVLCVNQYSVQSLFVQSLFVATTTPCNWATCHQYEQYKKSIVYNTSNHNDIN